MGAFGSAGFTQENPSPFSDPSQRQQARKPRGGMYQSSRPFSIGQASPRAHRSQSQGTPYGAYAQQPAPQALVPRAATQPAPYRPPEAITAWKQSAEGSKARTGFAEAGNTYGLTWDAFNAYEQARRQDESNKYGGGKARANLEMAAPGISQAATNAGNQWDLIPWLTNKNINAAGAQYGGGVLAGLSGFMPSRDLSMEFVAKRSGRVEDGAWGVEAPRDPRGHVDKVLTDTVRSIASTAKSQDEANAMMRHFIDTGDLPTGWTRGADGKAIRPGWSLWADGHFRPVALHTAPAQATPVG